MSKNETLTMLANAGMLVVVVAIAIPLFKGYIDPTFKWIYAAGALMLLCGRLFFKYDCKNIRLKRLLRLEIWGALFFCVAAFFLFYSPQTMRDALAFTLAGGIIQIYTSIMIPIVVKKGDKEEEKEEGSRKQSKKK